MHAIDGLHDKKEREEAITRRSTIIIASAMGGKRVAATIEKVWPMKNDSKESLGDRARKRLKEEKEKEDKRKVNKVLNGRRT